MSKRMATPIQPGREHMSIKATLKLLRIQARRDRKISQWIQHRRQKQEELNNA